MTSAALAEAYRLCDGIAKAEAGNFYWAFHFLPRPQRTGMAAVYAFARQTDDIADLADDAGRIGRIQKLRTDLRDAIAGRPATPTLAALADTAARFSLTPKYLEMILDGAEQDVRVNRYATFAALREYCRLVASSVGLICLELFGCRDDRAKPMAEKLGVALQMTNILRDVREDASRGRIYLPQEDLRAAGCSEKDIIDGRRSDAFLKVCAVNAARSREHYEQALPLLGHLSAVARRTVALMAAFYSNIQSKIEQSGYPVLERRVGLTRMEKSAIFLGVLFRPTFPIPSSNGKI